MFFAGRFDRMCVVVEYESSIHTFTTPCSEQRLMMSSLGESSFSRWCLPRGKVPILRDKKTEVVRHVRGLVSVAGRVPSTRYCISLPLTSVLNTSFSILLMCSTHLPSISCCLTFILSRTVENRLSGLIFITSHPSLVRIQNASSR
jgi:hypothetical protein